jgi:MFS family permease
MLILGGLQAVTPISTDLYLPALPTIARDLNVAPGAVQLTLAVFMIGVAIGQVAYGPHHRQVRAKAALALRAERLYPPRSTAPCCAA